MHKSQTKGIKKKKKHIAIASILATDHKWPSHLFPNPRIQAQAFLLYFPTLSLRPQLTDSNSIWDFKFSSVGSETDWSLKSKIRSYRVSLFCLPSKSAPSE